MQTTKNSLIIIIKSFFILLLGYLIWNEIYSYTKPDITTYLLLNPISFLLFNATVYLLLIPLFFINIFKDKKFKLKNIIFSKKNLVGIAKCSISMIILQYILYKFLELYIFSNYPTIKFNAHLALFFLIIFINASIEEFVFRVTLFEVINRKVTNIKLHQILISSLIFAIYHPVYYKTGIIHFLFSFAVGILLGYIYIKTKNFFYVSLLHSIYNFGMSIIQQSFPFDTGISPPFSSSTFIILYGMFIFAIVFLIFKSSYKKKLC